jgi:hypothetical protein
LNQLRKRAVRGVLPRAPRAVRYRLAPAPSGREAMQQILDVILHLDVHLNQWAASLGPWTYVLLFAIVFARPDS